MGERGGGKVRVLDGAQHSFALMPMPSQHRVLALGREGVKRGRGRRRGRGKEGKVEAACGLVPHPFVWRLEVRALWQFGIS